MHGNNDTKLTKIIHRIIFARMFIEEENCLYMYIRMLIPWLQVPVMRYEGAKIVCTYC